jgi:ferric-dicitrate binding protein FerR (iron transport regulator)
MRFNVRPVRVLSALTLIAVINVYVFAAGAIVPKSTSEAATAKVLLGKLVTTSNRPIVVNGAEAITGTMILSGAQLVTPAASLATVQLDNLGTVTIAPKSNVTLTFDSKNVAVRIISGDATLSTVDGVKGTVVAANGAPRNMPAPVPTDADTARNWGIAGVAVGGAAFIWALIAWNKANDANDKADALAAQLAALRACLAGQSASPVRVCTSF